MKKIILFSALVASLGFAAQANAGCSSPKYCSKVPNATNGWSNAVYVCGCNDVTPPAPGVGEKKVTPPAAINSNSPAFVIPK